MINRLMENISKIDGKSVLFYLNSMVLVTFTAFVSLAKNIINNDFNVVMVLETICLVLAGSLAIAFWSNLKNRIN